MKYFSKAVLALAFTGAFSFLSQAQQVVGSNQQDFDEFMDRSGNRYRSASGVPGPDYWQNEADYKIKATLDDQMHLNS